MTGRLRPVQPARRRARQPAPGRPRPPRPVHSSGHAPVWSPSGPPGPTTWPASGMPRSPAAVSPASHRARPDRPARSTKEVSYSLPCHFLHGPVLQLGAPAQRLGLIVRESPNQDLHPGVSSAPSSAPPPGSRCRRRRPGPAGRAVRAARSPPAGQPGRSPARRRPWPGHRRSPPVPLRPDRPTTRYRTPPRSPASTPSPAFAG